MGVYKGPIVDIDLHYGPKKAEEVFDYLPKNWREFAEGGGRMTGHTGNAGNWAAVAPHNAQMKDAYPEDNEFGPGQDYGFTKRQMLDKHNFYRCILNAGTSEPLNTYAGPVMAKALNDWTIDTWLAQGDERVYAVALIGGNSAEECAAEIRRVGKHPRIAAAQYGAEIFGRAIGDPIYDPIYAAATEVGIPVHVHPGGGAYGRQATGPSNTAVNGVPIQLTQFAMHNITSLIVHGTFEKFPTLKIMIKEHGSLWLQHLMWRLDANYKVLKVESPWVKRLPSEVIREHIFMGTHPFEAGFLGTGADVNQVLENTDGLSDMLCFATDYPHMNCDDPAFISRRLPTHLQRKIMVENACRLHGWDAPAADWGVKKAETRKTELVEAAAD